jgi:hypothetical protein
LILQELFLVEQDELAPKTRVQKEATQQQSAALQLRLSTGLSIQEGSSRVDEKFAEKHGSGRMDTFEMLERNACKQRSKRQRSHRKVQRHPK